MSCIKPSSTGNWRKPRYSKGVAYGAAKAAEHLDLLNSETPQFIGRAVAALATDKYVIKNR